MKIMHFIYQLSTGGLENGLINLVNYLPAENYEHIIVCLKSSDAFLTRVKSKNVTVINLALPAGSMYRHYYKIYQLIKKHRPDIVHTRNLASIEIQLLAFLAGTRYRIHGEHGRGIEDLAGNNKKHIFFRKIMSLFIHQFVSLSKEIKAYLQNKVLIQKKKIKQIYNGVNLDLFKPEKNKKDKIIKLMMVGRMEPVKDPMVLLNAFNRLLHDFPMIHLMVVGDGSMLPKMKGFVDDKGIADKVSFLGDCHNVHQVLSEGDLLVQSSLIEGISNTILEAMACGLPVVATSVGGNTEIVEERVTGRLVSPGSVDELVNAIQYYLEDNEKIDEHGQNARKRVERRFSLEEMVSQYDTLYKRLV